MPPDAYSCRRQLYARPRGSAVPSEARRFAVCERESAWRKPRSAPQEERGESEHNLWLKVHLYAAAFNFLAVFRTTTTPHLGQSADFALRGRARFGEAETGGRAACRPTHIAAAGSYMLARAGQQYPPKCGVLLRVRGKCMEKAAECAARRAWRKRA